MGDRVTWANTKITEHLIGKLNKFCCSSIQLNLIVAQLLKFYLCNQPEKNYINPQLT